MLGYTTTDDINVSTPSRKKPKLGLLYIYDKTKETLNIQPEAGLSDSLAPVHNEKEQNDTAGTKTVWQT